MEYIKHIIYHISGVTVTVLALSAVDRGYDPQLDLIKDYEIGICCFFSENQHLGVRAKTGWLEIRIMCQSGATCLPVDC